MKSEQINQFKILFEEQKNQLLSSQTLQSNSLVIEKDELMDEVDLTLAEREQSMMLRLKSRETLYLRKIESALQRIKNGTFGICKDCDDPIDLRRMIARPTAVLCIACKEMSEHKENLHIDGLTSKSLNQRIKISIA